MPSPPPNSDLVLNRASSPSIVVSTQQSLEASSYNGPKASQRSCITCRRRKVRCNKEAPCSNCVRNGVSCVFPPPGRARPAPRGRRSDAGQSSINRKEQGAQHLPPDLRVPDKEPENNGGRTNPQGNASVTSSRARSFRGFDDAASSKNLWIERCLYFGERPPKPLYQIGSLSAASRDNGGDIYATCLTRLIRLLAESPRSVPDDTEDEEMELASDNDDAHSVDRLLETTPTNLDHDDFILGCNLPNDNQSSSHPSPSEIPFYWQTFIENVDPLIKIFHIPSMTKTIREMQRNIRSLSPSEDALMLAIYLAAVTSMTPDEAQELLSQDKETLVARYRLFTKNALARAEFMSSSDLMTLQAIVVFLFCLRESDQSRFTWTMAALVVRIAQGLGIHRVRRGTDLSPYDTEISLRLWLNIWLLDFRVALDQGTDFLIPEGIPDMMLPLNINDSDLDPTSAEYPPLRTGMTDMAPVLAKYEIGLLMKKLSQLERGLEGEGHLQTPDQEGMERMATACRIKVQENYLNNCGDDHSFQRLSVLNTRLFFAEIPLLIYYPILSSDQRSTLSPAARDRLLEASIETIECSYEVSTMWAWPCWAKQHCTYVHWHAVSVILEELCVRSNKTELAQKAWNAIELAISCWGSSTQQQDGLWKPLMRLVKKAKRKRDANHSLCAQDATEAECNVDDVSMPVDWAMMDSEIPLSWPTEFSATYLYDGVGEDFLFDSVGSPSELFD